MMHRRLASVLLVEPVSDPTDRGLMPMSTVFSTDQWMIEVAWDGAVIGDAQIFKNRNCNANGARALDTSDVPLPKAWVWWAGVPRGKIKSYRFEDAGEIRPMTPDPDDVPFATSDAQRKAEPRQASKSGASPA